MIELDSSHPLFINDVIESILIYKWENYAKNIFYFETFLQVLFLLIYLMNVVIIIPGKCQLINIYQGQGLSQPALSVTENSYLGASLIINALLGILNFEKLIAEFS